MSYFYRNLHLFFRVCERGVLGCFRSSSNFSFCYLCDRRDTCDGNVYICRIILLVLKSLRSFRAAGAYDASLVSVFGSSLTDKFAKDFCVHTGTYAAFNDRNFRCTIRPSPTVMPRLLLSERLDFTFSFSDMYGETEVELADRINAQFDRDQAI